MKRMLVFAVVAASLVLSCGSSEKRLVKKGLYRCNERLEAARKDVDRRAYSSALRILEEIKYQCGGSPMMDTVYYYAGTAHFRQKQYEDARHEFELLYREHPRSPFADEAHFRVAHTYYIRSRPPFRDQAETKEAIRLLDDYLDIYPNGAYADSARIMFKQSLNKLALKEFNNALFYRKQKQHEAALIYYRAVLSQYPDSNYASESVVGMAEMLLALVRVQDAQEALEELEFSAFDEGLRVRLEAVRAKLKS